MADGLHYGHGADEGARRVNLRTVLSTSIDRAYTVACTPLGVARVA
jgi:hypothetical protein